VANVSESMYLSPRKLHSFSLRD